MADFQQFYGLALPLEGDPGDLPRMALLWDMLPEQSRTARRQRPELAWTTADYMLWRMEHQLRLLSWGLSDKKSRSPRAPQPLKTPGQLADARARRDHALAARAEIDTILGMEVRDGD